jgi:septum formation inhibitor-activating ATPase MinD
MNIRSLLDLVKAEFPKEDEVVLKEFTHEGFEIFANHCYTDIDISLVNLMKILGIEEKVAQHLFDDKDSNVFLSATVVFDDEVFKLSELSFEGTNIVLNQKTYLEFEKFHKIKDILKDLDVQYEAYKAKVEKVNSDIFDFVYFHCEN